MIAVARLTPEPRPPRAEQEDTRPASADLRRRRRQVVPGDLLVCAPVADVGDDGAGQAIRMDYRCQAFRDPRLGEVVGHRWVTTDVDGRRRDFHVTAYTGWLETIDEPDLTRRIVESIRPE